ncbi:MAG: WD40 repeat domain-containing protein [Myxococcaceae bacterium]
MSVLRLGGGNGLVQPRRITALAVSPNGRFAITGDDEGFARVFDLEARQQVFELGPPKAEVRAGRRAVERCCIADTGRVAAVQYGDHDQLFLGATSTWRPVRVSTHQSDPRFTLSPDGKHLALATGNVRSFAGTKEVADFWEGRATDLAPTPDGHVAVVFTRRTDEGPFKGKKGGVVRVQSATGRQLARVEIDHNFSWARCGVLPDGTVLVVTDTHAHWWHPKAKSVKSRPLNLKHARFEVLSGRGLIRRELEGTTALLDPSTGKVIDSSDRLWASSTDGRVLVSGDDAVLELHDPATLAPAEAKSGLRSAVGAVAFEPDGAAVWSLDADSARRWKLPDGQADVVHALPKGFRGLRLSADARVALLTDGETMRALELSTGKPLGKPLDGAPRLPALSADGALLLQPGKKGHVELWDVKRSKRVRTFDFASPEYCYGLAFSADDAVAVACSERGELHAWRVDSGQRVAHFRVPGRAALGLAVARDAKWLVMGSDSADVHLLDLPRGGLRHQLGVKRKTVWQVVLSPDGRRVAAIDDQHVYVWDAKSGKRLLLEPLAAHSVAWSPDSKRVVVGCMGELFVVDVGRR